MCVRSCVCACMYVYVCVHVCVHMCVYVCVCVCAYRCECSVQRSVEDRKWCGRGGWEVGEGELIQNGVLTMGPRLAATCSQHLPASVATCGAVWSPDHLAQHTWRTFSHLSTVYTTSSTSCVYSKTQPVYSCLQQHTYSLCLPQHAVGGCPLSLTPPPNSYPTPCYWTTGVCGGRGPGAAHGRVR